MFEITAFATLARALSNRNFELSTSFGSFGSSFEALRSFPNGDYYLFTLALDNVSPLRLEIHQDGHDTNAEFESLISFVDARKIILYCEETRFPYSW